MIWVQWGADALVDVALCYAILAVYRRHSRRRLPLEPSALGLQRIAVEWAAEKGEVFAPAALAAMAGAQISVLVPDGVGQATVVVAQPRHEGRVAMLVLEAPARTVAAIIESGACGAQVPWPGP